MHTSCLISAAVFTCLLFNLSLPVLSYPFSFSPTIMASARSFHGVGGIQNDTPYTLEPRKRHVGRKRISAKCASPHRHFVNRIYRDSDPSDRRDSGSYSQKLRSPVAKWTFTSCTRHVQFLCHDGYRLTRSHCLTVMFHVHTKPSTETIDKVTSPYRLVIHFLQALIDIFAG